MEWNQTVLLFHDDGDICVGVISTTISGILSGSSLTRVIILKVAVKANPQLTFIATTIITPLFNLTDDVCLFQSQLPAENKSQDH